MFCPRFGNGQRNGQDIGHRVEQRTEGVVGRDIHRTSIGGNRLKMSDAVGATSMLVMRAMSLVIVMFVMVLMLFATMGALTNFRIVLQAKDFLMMVMGQYRCRQHHYADYH